MGKLRDPVKVGGEKPPNPTQLAGIALDENSRWGALLYDQASGIAHGRASVVLRMTDSAPGVRTDPGVAGRRLRTSSTDAALAVAAAVLTHQAATRLLADATGHQLDPRWHATLDQLVARVRTYLRPAADRVRGEGQDRP